MTRIRLMFDRFAGASVLAGFLAWAMLASTGHAQPQSSPATADEQTAGYALKRFMQFCVSSRSDRKTAEELARRMDLQQLEAQAAGSFIGNSPGSVWVEQTGSGYFALGARDGGTCSIFARKVDAGALTAAFKGWLPPVGSGYDVEALPVFRNQNQTTITYNIKQRGELFAAWSLSTSTIENAIYQGVITMKKF